MAEANDARKLVLEIVVKVVVERDDANDDDDGPKLTINDLPKELLVSIFAAIDNPTWVRFTFPCVCKAWAELYRSKDASPLHETLEVDFRKEVIWARGKEEEEEEEEAEEEEEDEENWEPAPGDPVVHASRVIPWAARRDGSVRKLLLKGQRLEDFGDFNSEDLATLFAVVGSSLTEIRIDCNLSKLYEEPFWATLRASVFSTGRLRSLVLKGVEDIDPDAFGSKELAGSLEELVLEALRTDEDEGEPILSSFPESLCALTELRRLVLLAPLEPTSIPAEISSLQKLEELDLCCDLRSLPKELGELSGLTKLDLSQNRDLGTALPAGEAFPAELGKMKSLRDLNLSECGLSAVPAFVCELKSLESLNLSYCELRSLPKELGELSGLTKLDLSRNRTLGATLPAGEAFPAELGKMKSLRDLQLNKCGHRTVPAFVGELESLEVLNLSFVAEAQIRTPLDFLIKGCPRLRVVMLHKFTGEGWNAASRALLKAFAAKLVAKNPDALVERC